MILITLALFAAISLGVLTVARRSLAAPIRDLLVGAEALGEGDLEYRVIVPPRRQVISPNAPPIKTNGEKID